MKIPVFLHLIFLSVFEVAAKPFSVKDILKMCFLRIDLQQQLLEAESFQS